MNYIEHTFVIVNLPGCVSNVQVYTFAEVSLPDFPSLLYPNSKFIWYIVYFYDGVL